MKYTCVVTLHGEKIDEDETTAEDVDEAMEYLFDKHKINPSAVKRCMTEPGNPSDDEEIVGLRCWIDGGRLFSVAKA